MWWTGIAIDPARHRYRWYTLTVQPTLWDTWECWAAWGRIGQRPRGCRLLATGPLDAVLEAAQRQQRRKERRGYVCRGSGA